MRRFVSYFCLLAASLCGAVGARAADAKRSGEISAQLRMPGYDKVTIDSLGGAQLVCRFETADLKASHTVELSIRGKKADGKFTKWRTAEYNPDVNYDYTETSALKEAVDKEILKAQKADVVYGKSHDAVRDDKSPEKAVSIALPAFDDVTDAIVGYEVKIKYTNDCVNSGKCAWTIE
ncbi:MAG: hypothetical protein K2K97_09750 [Muribaculaceae bacterium]|nr:hypothetical protein [Muribaculaceae bacterium]